MKQIKELITLTTNLFNYINYDFSDIGVNNSTLNFYFISKYSNRWCSPVLDLLTEDGEISTANFTTLGTYINQLYKSKWDKLKALLILQYDPVHNYLDELTENITDTDDSTRNDTISVAKTISKMTSDNTGIYGFNSDSSVSANDGSGTVSETDSIAYSNETDIDRDYTRAKMSKHTGNIGNISTQDLLQKEVDFWQWNFIIQVLSDVADVITLPIY